MRKVLAAVALASVAAILAPASASAYVYWSTYTGATIARANLDGSDVNQNFITGASFPEDVAVDSGHVYWMNPPTMTIGRADINGTGANQSFISVAPDNPNDVDLSPRGLTVDASHIYWTRGQISPFITGTVGRANLDGSNINQNLITGLFGDPFDVAVDATHIYWADYGHEDFEDSIGRANLDGGGTDQRFLRSISTGGSVAVDATHIYWANRFGGTIGRANLDGSDVNQNFITGLGSPFGVAVDASHIYWSDLSGDTIGRANLDGSASDQNFITGAISPHGIAVDALGPPANTTIPGLVDSVKALGLSTGIERSLLGKLENAEQGLGQNHTQGSCGKLAAFINEVRALSGKRIDAGDASALIADAEAIRASAHCS